MLNGGGDGAPAPRRESPFGRRSAAGSGAAAGAAGSALKDADALAAALADADKGLRAAMEGRRGSMPWAK